MPIVVHSKLCKYLIDCAPIEDSHGGVDERRSVVLWINLKIDHKSVHFQFCDCNNEGKADDECILLQKWTVGSATACVISVATHDAITSVTTTVEG